MLRALVLSALPLTLAACGGHMMQGGGGYGAGPGGGPMFVTSLAPTQGNTATGSVMFHDMGGGQVMVHARLSGLKPGGEHGFHVHEKGDCSSPDAMSAGGHWNPTGKPHGAQDGERHAGDMPNLRADAQGRADQRYTLKDIPVADLAGKAVVVHANPDDYRSQPAGNSGPRVACGVIARR